MNIDRLKELADTIEKGVIEFPELGKVVAFNQGTIYKNVEHGEYVTNWVIPERPDVPDRRKCNACGCTQGFTILLFSPLKYRMIADSLDDADIYTECRLLLELKDDQAFPLFYGNVDMRTTGEKAARMVRKLIMTGNLPLNW